MVGIVGLVMLLAVLAALCAAITFALHKLAPHVSLKRRTLSSAFGGAGLVMLVPVIAVIGEGGIALAAMVAVMVMLAIVVGFPVSYYLAKRLDTSPAAVASSDVFD